MSYQIFLVEDHPAMCQAYVQILDREADLDVCGMVETAEDFLDQLHDISCDLLLTDLSLPGMDGFALVERIRSERPELPVIIVSAHQDVGHQVRGQQAGAQAYLTKDHIARHLGPTIRRVMEEGVEGPGSPNPGTGAAPA